MQGRVVIDYTNMVIDYQRATLPETTACNQLHYYGNRLPVVILARKQKQQVFQGRRGFELLSKYFSMKANLKTLYE